MTDRPDAMDHATNTGKNIWQRMTTARVAMRGLKIWDQFTIEGKTFEAFGISPMVGGLEPIMLQNGIYPVIDGLRWEKNGSQSVVTGTLTLVNIDNPDERIVVHSVGEGIDPSDKGINKAITSLIKNLYRQAFVLAVGTDVESSNERNMHPNAPAAQNYPPQAGPMGQGVPHRSQQAREEVRQNGQQAHGHQDHAGPADGGYVLSFNPVGQPTQLAAKDILAAVGEWLASLTPGDAASIETFIANNKAELDRFADEDTEGRYIKPVEQLIINARRKAYDHAA